MGDTHIAWTNKTWNPVTGCTKVSQGCKHCYAETIANRMWATQYKPNADGTARRFTDVRLHPDRLEMPLHWRKPAMVFVNSMSDLFHEDVPDEFILQMFSVMERCPQHIFQVLTKRPERMVDVLGGTSGAGLGAPLLPNVWLGVSVEDQANADERIPLLLEAPAAIRFLSCEPLLGPIDLTRIPDPFGPPVVIDSLRGFYYNKLHAITRIGWVIVGGESGPHHRPMATAWAEGILYQCQAAGVACFIKQMGGKHPGTAMEDLPPILRVREFPHTVPV